MKIGLICNPLAQGGKAGGRLPEAARILRGLGCEVLERLTEARGDGVLLAQEFAERVDRVAVLGGDGTVNEVANGLAWSGTPMAVIPAGTINVLALELGIPFQTKEACAIVVHGRTETLDLGRVNERYFVLMAGAGIDALTIRELSPPAKRRYSELAFVWTGLRSYLRHPLPDFAVIVDGEEHTANFAVVGNCHYYGGRFGVTTRADPADGLLDVVMYKGRGFPSVAAFWAGLPLGLSEHHPDVLYVRGRAVSLRPLGPGDVVWVQADGELVGRLPVDVQIQPGALQVLVRDRS